MLTDRQKLLLKAIVEEYIKTCEPVGSKVLTEKPYLNFSSATLRYEMAQLEELGYLEKTHTSSGRTPSHLGYKYYVENLVTRDYSVQDSFPLIDEIFNQENTRKEDVIKNAINLLSSLTNHTAMLLGPDLTKSRVKKLEIVQINEKECIVIIITNLGYIQSQKVNLDEDINFNDLQKVISSLDDILQNLPLKDVTKILTDHKMTEKIQQYLHYQDKIINLFLRAFQKFTTDNYYMAGMSKIFDQPEFRDINKVQGLIELMGNRKLFRLVDTKSNSLSITIGKENKISYLQDCTIISVPYRINDEEYGSIAIIGPTRMQYNKIIPLLEYIAKNMTKLYNDEEGS